MRQVFPIGLTSRRGWQHSLIFLAFGLPLVVLVVLPLFLLLLNSFRRVGLGEIEFAFNNFTLSNYVVAYTNPKTWKMLWDSFLFAIGSTCVSFILGGAMAFLVERTDAPFRRLTYAVMFAPLIIPGMLQAIAWVLLLSPNIGLVNKVWYSMGFDTPLVNAYSMPVMWWVQGILMSPLTFILLGAALRRIDPSLEEAAMTSGASRVKIALQVTARLMVPGIASAALLQFVFALESLEIPLFLGRNSGIVVFSTNILSSIQETFPPDYGLGFSYSVILMGLAALALLAYQRMMARTENYAVVSGKGYRPRVVNLGNWKAFAGGFEILFAVVALGLPFVVLVWASLLPSYQVPSMEMLHKLSLRNYVTVFGRPDTMPMLRNTAILAISTSLVVMVFSLLLSWFIFRMKLKGGRVLDGLVFIPYAIPAIAMGIAFMVVFLSFKNPFYGTIWILVIAYIVRELPYGTRFTHAGLVQIHRELEEAAKVSGASFREVLFRIIGPIMLPSLIGGALYVFVISVKIFAIAAVLSSPESMVLSMQIWQLWSEGSLGELAALAVVMMAGLSILTFLVGTRRLAQIAH